MDVLQQRRTLILGIAGAVVLVAIIAFAMMANNPYRGLNTERDVILDELTQDVVSRRLAISVAALEAQKASGEEVDLHLYNSIALDAWTMGDLVLAREILEEYFTHHNLNYTAWNHYGNILLEMGDEEAAEEAYYRALQLTTEVEEFWRDYIELIELDPERDEEVKVVLEELIAVKGQTSWNMVKLAEWYENHGDCEEAIAHHEIAADLAPDNEGIQRDLEALKATCGE